jgi:hypothetical protein
MSGIGRASPFPGSRLLIRWPLRFISIVALGRAIWRLGAFGRCSKHLDKDRTSLLGIRFRLLAQRVGHHPNSFGLAPLYGHAGEEGGDQHDQRKEGAEAVLQGSEHG